MQFLNILRGCGATYLAAVIAIVGTSMVVDGNGIAILWPIGAIGLVIALPYVLFASVVWLLLARRRAHVHWWHAVLICSAAFTVSAVGGTLWDGGEYNFLFVALTGAGLGIAAGIVFWLGAFGTQRAVVMGDPPP